MNNGMHIRKGEMSDFNRLMELFYDARLYMAENGNPTQWKDSWPPDDLIKEDIEKRDNFVCIKDNIVVGTFYLGRGIDPTYINIYDGEWIDDTKPYVVVHRITTDRQSKGIGKFILDSLYSEYGNVRIDTHKDNKPMLGLLKACGFKYCGIIYLENGEERVAFQKV